MNIVGFAGPARAGKTTAAGFLTESLVKEGQQVYHLSFATPLKNAINCLGIDKDTLPTLYRKMAQQIGSMLRDPEYVPGITGPNYFVNLMAQSIGQLIVAEQQEYDAGDEDDGDWGDSTAIIDDVRYPNEVEMIRKMGGTVAFIDPDKRIDLSDDFRKHESERFATECLTDKEFCAHWTDMVIVNDSTLEDFGDEIGIFKFNLTKETYGTE